MALDWDARLETSHTPPREAFLQAPVPTTTRRRVMVGRVAGWPRDDREKEKAGVFLYDEAGVCRVDGQPGLYDLVNVA
jgi:hypothetical protein